MMLVTFILTILFLNNVYGGAISHKGNEDVKRGLRDTHKYNHPPSAEYLSVPVEVLYEDGNREQKSITIKTSTEKNNDSLNNLKENPTEPEVISLESSEDVPDLEEIHEDTTVSTPKDETEQNVNSTVQSDLKSHEENHVKKGPKIVNFQNGLIIPVSVVYDVEPEHFQRRSKPRAIYTKKSINRQQSNKNILNKKSDKEESTETHTESNLSENKETSTLFPKRQQTKPDPVVPIVQSENYVYSHSGDFHYSYEGGDGTKAFERGELTSDKGGESVVGSFSYIGKDGNDYSLTYTADENGYRPVGAHLPTPPPIPPAIARALKYLATKPTSESITESYL